MPLPDVLKNRDFKLFWSGVVLSQIGVRGADAANYYQVYELTGSVFQTGLVGAGQAVALLLLSPLGGAYADRLDRRRLLQCAQGMSLLVALGLAVLTLTGQAQAWHIILSALLTTTAATFDQPARQALIPALVPRHHLAQAVALLNPSRELAILVGPALAGFLIAFGGPGLVYLVNAATYATLVAVLAVVRVSHPTRPGPPRSIFGSIADGARYVVRRRLIVHLMALDLAATVLSAYRVLLPALALDVLHIGPTGFGLLAAAPSAGALLATYTAVRTVQRSGRLGRVVLVSTMLYGLAAILLGQSRWFALALSAGMLLGVFDAMATSIRHAVVQIETPDGIRGRVIALYQMAARGGPALGDVAVGAFASVVGPMVALTIGGVGPILVAVAYLSRPNVVREYASMPTVEPERPPETLPEPPAARETPTSDP